MTFTTLIQLIHHGCLSDRGMIDRGMILSNPAENTWYLIHQTYSDQALTLLTAAWAESAIRDVTDVENGMGCKK